MVGTATSNSILHVYMSEKTIDIGPLIGQSWTCFNNFSLTENTHAFANVEKTFINRDFLHKDSISFSTQILFTI